MLCIWIKHECRACNVNFCTGAFVRAAHRFVFYINGRLNQKNTKAREKEDLCSRYLKPRLRTRQRSFCYLLFLHVAPIRRSTPLLLFQPCPYDYKRDSKSRYGIQGLFISDRAHVIDNVEADTTRYGCYIVLSEMHNKITADLCERSMKYQLP